MRLIRPFCVLTVVLLCMANVKANSVNAPIVINGTAQLRRYASQGDGSMARPFLLAGLRIDAGGAPYCLEIKNISDHFVIRDCQFTGASKAAIKMDNVRNGWVVDCVITNSAIGVLCMGGTRDIVFVGNVFQNNAFDASLPDASVQWDDGYMGNYWDRYQGTDENRDGIGDVPYSLHIKQPNQGNPIDRFPLVEPIANVDIKEEEKVLLRVQYEVGNSWQIRVSADSRVTTKLLIFSSVTQAHTEQLIQQRVLASPGTGFFTLEETILKDSGHITVDGIPQPYESSEGMTTLRQVHRLGIMTEPGYGIVGVEMAGVTIAAQLPARPVAVGNSWTTSWTVDMTKQGMDSGEQQIKATFTLLKLEMINDELCAVIDGKADITAYATKFDPTLGHVKFIGKGYLHTTVYFALSKKRILKQAGNMKLELIGSAMGTTIFQQEWEVSATLEELPKSKNETLSPNFLSRTLPEQLQQALVLLAHEEYETAEQAFRMATELFHTAGRVEFEAAAWWGVGTALMGQEKYKEALKAFEKAKTLYHNMGATRDESVCLNSMGICYRRLGEHMKALDCYKRILVLTSTDPELKSTALVNMGFCCIAMGKYSEAIKYLEEARALRQGRDMEGEINVLNSLGICYRKLGQYDKALACYDEALKLCITTLTSTFLKGVVLGNKGVCYMEMGKFDLALSSLLEAQKILAKSGAGEVEAGVWIQIAMCQQRGGKPEAAVSALEHALSLSQRSDIVGSANYLKGWCYLDLHDPFTARPFFEKAREWAQKGGDLESLWRCEWGLAKSWWDIGDYHKDIGDYHKAKGSFEKAKKSFEKAVDLVEKARARIEKERVRRGYFHSVKELYQDYLSFLYETGEKENTLWIAERCRARTFLDLLAKGPVGTLENIVEEGLRTGVVEPEKLEADAGEVIQSLPQGTVVLEYFVTERATYAWVIRRGRIEGPVELPHGREELLKEIIKTRKAMEDQTNPIVNRYLAELYDWLIHPLEGLLPESHEGEVHLVIIPSGPLWYLPFQALSRPGTWSSRYLIQDYTISYAPSLTVLKYAWLNRGKARPELCLLGIADPDPKDPSIPRLPEAREEAKAAAKAFPCHELYFDKEATEDVVQSRSSVFRHLLISTHGFFNPWNPMFSYLLLSPTQRTDGKLHAYEVFGLKLGAETVVLSACETLLPSLRKAKEEAKVIWGSEEGKPVELSPKVLEELTTGEEIVGLTRAFFSAGAASVVSTLWSVPSKATRELMVRFYEGLREGLDKASALREAQLAVLGNKGWEHPYFWAAFCLSGDWGVPLSLGK